jgi:diguanylate cyclase (GGDEF)-like protein
MGGDEFAVIFPQTAAAAASVVRDRIVHAIRQTPAPLGEHQIKLSLSIGIASLPGDATESDALIAAADSAMYQVKQASRSLQALVI